MFSEKPELKWIKKKQEAIPMWNQPLVLDEITQSFVSVIKLLIVIHKI